MDIQFYGANCLMLSSKQIRVVIDDTLASLGAKSITREGDIALFTGTHEAPTGKPKIVIDVPGEYEVGGVSVFGLQVRSHMDEEGVKSGVMYKITWGELRIVVAGHVFPKLSETDLEALGVVDVLFVPVGGNGYTTDATGALQLIKQIDPKLVIPTHFADSSLKFEVPQQTLEDALKTLSMEPKETTKKLQLKVGELTPATQLVILEKA